MGVSRAAVLDALAEQSSSSPPRTTTVSDIAESLGADAQTVRVHATRLVECGLARRDDGGIRVTSPGATVAKLDVEGVVVVDPEEEQ